MTNLPFSCVERNPLVCENQVTYRPRRSRRNRFGVTTFQERTRRTLERIVLSCGGVCDWPTRRLAAACGISASQFLKDVRVICRLGLVVRIHRRGTACRNATNLWKLPQLGEGGVGVINAREKQEIVLETTTPRSGEHGSDRVVEQAPRPPRPAYSRRAENHDPAFRRMVEHNQRLKAENRGLRAIHWGRNHDRRQRMAMQAQVGMAHTFTPAATPSPGEWAEYEAVRERCDAQAAAARAAEAAKRDRDRVERAEYADRIKREAAEPLSAELQERVARLNRRAGVRTHG